MAERPHKVLVIGLPQTGKTTFLAALWDVVDSQEVKACLALDRLEGDQQYLNHIRDLWANCQPIPRTRVADECIISMRLRDIPTGVCSDVSFPDMDGESFQRQWTERVWSSVYRDLVRAATGILLFIHPSKVREAPLIRDARPLVKRLSGGERKEGNEKPARRRKEEPAGGQTVPAEPRYAPTQVQLVQLLQFLRVPREDMTGLQLGVVISAWDVVMKQERCTPEVWLERRLPLLHQFLRTNSDTIPFRVYGVSAQGGDLQDAERLRQMHCPSERIMVEHAGERSHDITAPVRWAMGTMDDPGD